MKTILSIMGTRPEIIKFAPVIRTLNEDDGLDSLVLSTSQHREMSDQFFNEFNIRPDFDLDVMIPNQTLAYLTSEISKRLDKIFLEVKPDVILVQGDTTSAYIGGLIAFYHKIPVGHIEAGLRTNDIYSPFPEELNRQMLSRLTTLNFAPTVRAKLNLQRDNIPEKTIFYTGNTIVDSLQYLIASDEKLRRSAQAYSGDKIILVTAHRRENLGKPLKSICDALQKIVNTHKDCQIIFPVHPNPKVRKIVNSKLKGNKQIELIEPVDYKELISYMMQSKIILTDSGGIQEESPTLNKPVLIMRKETERPEIIEAGGGILVGSSTDNIVECVNNLFADEKLYNTVANCVNPFGDGLASKRIVEIIRSHFELPVDKPTVPLMEIQKSGAIQAT